MLLVYGIIHALATRDFAGASRADPDPRGRARPRPASSSSRPAATTGRFDVTLFRNRGYAVSLTAVSLAFFAMSGITFTLPFYLQILRGYDTLQAGLCFLPFAIGQLLAAPRSAAWCSASATSWS